MVKHGKTIPSWGKFIAGLTTWMKQILEEHMCQKLCSTEQPQFVCHDSNPSINININPSIDPGCKPPHSHGRLFPRCGEAVVMSLGEPQRMWKNAWLRHALRPQPSEIGTIPANISYQSAISSHEIAVFLSEITKFLWLFLQGHNIQPGPRTPSVRWPQPVWPPPVALRAPWRRRTWHWMGGAMVNIHI